MLLADYFSGCLHCISTIVESQDQKVNVSGLQERLVIV